MVNLVRVKLVNFAPIKIGMGLDEIEIDRRNSRNNIILILAENGAGKTSLMSELTPIPMEHIGARNKSRIIPGKIGIKELDYIVNGQDEYKIKIIYDSLKKSTKCFINRNGIELNPNGNVETYLECVQHELGMEKQYINVGYLSGSVKDLISMKPNERNNYISEWMPEIGEFLDAHKISVKILNKLKKEIDNYNKEIGKMSSVNYELELNLLNTNIESLNQKITKISADIIELNTYQGQIKPLVATDQVLQDGLIKWKSLRNEVVKERDIIADKYSQIDSISCVSEEELTLHVSNVKTTINEKQNILDKIENELVLLQMEISSSRNMLSDDDRLKSRDLSATISMIETNQSILKDIEENLENDEGLITDDISNLKIFKTMIPILDDKFVQLNNLIGLDYIIELDKIENLVKNKNKNLEQLNFIINDKQNKLDLINKEIYKYEHGSIDEEILKKRPNFCKNANCGVINELMKYLDPSESAKELYENSKDLQKELMDLTAEKDKIENGLKDVLKSMQIYDEITQYLSKNTEIIAKLPTKICDIVSEAPGAIYTHMNQLKLLTEDSLQYNLLLEKKNELVKSIDELSNIKHLLITNSKLEDKIKESIVRYDKLKEDKVELIKELIELKKNLDAHEHYFDLVKEREIEIIKNNEKAELVNRYRQNLLIVNKNTYVYRSNNRRIEELENEKRNYQVELTNLNNKRDEMTTFYISKRQIESMRNEVQQEFNRVNVLNKVWSPRGTSSYPAMKIKNFLTNLIIKTNADLEGMWGSTLRIVDIEVNESDFNIIVNKNGNIIEDASLCSGGERSTLGLAISMAVIELSIEQYGYDVIRCDEIDASYDQSRRESFIEILQKRLDEIGIDSCFVISHNDNFSDIPSDVILLKGANIDNSKLKNKNIIFQL